MRARHQAGTTDQCSGERIMTLPLPKADSTIPAPPAAATPGVEQDSFVINLCSSTTPMALTQPQLVELKQYKFFVSRRLEDGRERFRLHMGYFDSLLLAEEVLPVVREIYPGAWAGEAPGKRLRAKAAAAPAPAAPAAAPVAVVQPAAEVVEQGPSPEILAKMPTLSAAPEPMRAEPDALTLELVATPPRPPMSELPSEVAAPPPPTGAPAKPAARAAGARRDSTLPFDQRSNVREVLKSLDESAGKTAKPQAPAAIAAAAKPAAHAAPPASAKAPEPAVPSPASAPPQRQHGVLPESQVLHLLEEKRGDPLNTSSTPAAFAVQLQWSVQPIDLARVPSLAIFGAYTLYTVEGNREGRHWYGLRLGFFSDAISAKQVAQYVRSEFSSVAVVPVSLKERDGASGATGAAAAAPARPTERLPERTGEFKLLDDTANTPKLPAAAATAAAGKTPAAKPKAPAKAAAGKPAYSGRVPGKTARARSNRVQATEKRAPQTLEETLEILGADQLQIEGSRSKLVSEGSIRHLDMKVQKNSPFTRLLDRLAERNR